VRRSLVGRFGRIDIECHASGPDCVDNSAWRRTDDQRRSLTEISLLSPPPILVVTSAADQVNFEPVVRRLERAGLRAVVFKSDEVTNGSQRFLWTLSGGGICAAIDDEAFDVLDVRAAWWRKPDWLDIERADVGTRLSLENEIVRLQEDLWGAVPQQAWLNRPDRIRESNRRPTQLLAAMRVGFEVPSTIAGNSWEAVMHAASREDVIFKSLSGTLLRGGENRALFTTRLSGEDVRRLAAASTPYPGVIQPYIKKAREWRITVVDDDVFAAAIYAEGRGQADWRRAQFTPDVRFVEEPLESDVQARCATLTRNLGLGFAAIDLIETEGGDYVFLEANPNGQYLWLELMLGLDISEAIAAALARRFAQKPTRCGAPRQSDGY
jgi:hypothetical protein